MPTMKRLPKRHGQSLTKTRALAYPRTPRNAYRPRARVKRVNSKQAFNDVPGLSEKEAVALRPLPGLHPSLQQRNEPDRKQRLFGDPSVGLVDLDQRLGVAGRPQRNDHAAAWLQLIDQGTRGLRRSRSHDDAVIGRLRRP